MTYQATYVWSCPDGKFTSGSDAWKDRISLWTEEQQQQADQLFKQYAQGATINWDQDSNTMTVKANFGSQDLYLEHSDRWVALDLPTAFGWDLLSYELMTI